MNFCRELINLSVLGLKESGDLQELINRWWNTGVECKKTSNQVCNYYDRIETQKLKNMGDERKF